MGCDIHLHVEIKIDGKWEHWSAPDVERWYSLFGLMAGVRGESGPVVQPRGIPEDATMLTRRDFEEWDADAHTPSWLSWDEMAKVWDILTDSHPLERRGISFEHDILHCHPPYWGPEQDQPEARVVFWFDN